MNKEKKVIKCWNMRSAKMDKNGYWKIDIILNDNPILALLQENRNEIRVNKKYNYYYSEPAKMKRYKINCLTMISNEYQNELIMKKEDYLVCKIKLNMT